MPYSGATAGHAQGAARHAQGTARLAQATTRYNGSEGWAQNHAVRIWGGGNLLLAAPLTRARHVTTPRTVAPTCASARRHCLPPTASPRPPPARPAGPPCLRTGRVLEDTFFKKAKASGYVARSAYKLQEVRPDSWHRVAGGGSRAPSPCTTTTQPPQIQQKHKLIPPGGHVLDLGCHPGAWLQVRGSTGWLHTTAGCAPARHYHQRFVAGRMRIAGTSQEGRPGDRRGHTGGLRCPLPHCTPAWRATLGSRVLLVRAVRCAPNRCAGDQAPRQVLRRQGVDRAGGRALAGPGVLGAACAKWL